MTGLAYKTPDHGYCTSCPCLGDDERERRLSDALHGEVSLAERPNTP